MRDVGNKLRLHPVKLLKPVAHVVKCQSQHTYFIPGYHLYMAIQIPLCNTIRCILYYLYRITDTAGKKVGKNGPKQHRKARNGGGYLGRFTNGLLKQVNLFN